MFVLQFVYVTIIPPDNTIKLLFYIVIHRQLENGFDTTLLRNMSTILPYRKKDIDMLKRVQRRATKMIPTHASKRMWINNTRNQETERRSDRSV